MKQPVSRKALSAQGLYRTVRTAFERIPDPRPTRQISLSDILMSGLAMFSLKYPSLLQFDRASRMDPTVRPNLSTLFGVEQAPCDTTLRERLDEIDPQGFEKSYTRLFAGLQRGCFLRNRCIARTVARDTIETGK